MKPPAELPITIDAGDLYAYGCMFRSSRVGYLRQLYLMFVQNGLMSARQKKTHLCAIF